MRGGLIDIIVGHHFTSKYLISIDDYLQTFKEFKFKEVRFSQAQIKGGFFSNINICYKLK